MRAFFLQTVQSRRGFTLVEMAIAILISLIVMTAVTGVFIAHSRTYTQHDDISGLQQTMRSVMMTMPADLRLVGCDPFGTAGAGIEKIVVKPEQVEFEFTADIAGFEGRPNDADGEIKDENEQVAYKFLKGATCGGIPVPGGGTLCRKTKTTSFQPIADNIEALEFNYVMEDGTSTLTPPRSRWKNIRAVQISMLARSEFADPAYYHEGVYFPASCGKVEKKEKCEQKWEPTKGNPAEAHHRRRLLVTTIQLRNMGYTK